MQKTIYLIHCSDGVVYQNKDGKTYFSWSFDDMQKYASINDASGIFKTIFEQVHHDVNDLKYKIEFIYKLDKKMHDLL